MEKPTSESLAAVIVCTRLFGINKDEAKVCMSELLRRREEDNDIFDFENYINEKVNNIQNQTKQFESKNILSGLSLLGKLL
jgi:hypothetical protein